MQGNHGKWQLAAEVFRSGGFASRCAGMVQRGEAYNGNAVIQLCNGWECLKHSRRADEDQQQTLSGYEGLLKT